MGTLLNLCAGDAEGIGLRVRYHPDSDRAVVLELGRNPALILRPGEKAVCTTKQALRWEVSSGGVRLEAQSDGELQILALSTPGWFAVEGYSFQRRQNSRTTLWVSVMEKLPELYRQEFYEWPSLAPEGLSQKVRDHIENYQPPEYYFRLIPGTEQLQVLEGYPMNPELVCRAWPKSEFPIPFATLEIHLLDKLQRLNAGLRTCGLAKFKVRLLSGFRSPDYNRRIEGASLSRHIYGDAVDFLVDDDGDGVMDDVDGNGRIDRFDGMAVIRCLQALEDRGEVVVGGAGIYELDVENPRRVSLHMDCRGVRATWGYSYRGEEREEFEW